MLVNISVYQKNDVWYASIIENDRLKRIKIDGSLIQLLKQQGHKNYYECRISGCETSNDKP